MPDELSKLTKAKYFLLGMVTTFIVILLPVVLYFAFQFVIITESTQDRQLSGQVTAGMNKFFNELELEAIIEE